MVNDVKSFITNKAQGCHLPYNPKEMNWQQKETRSKQSLTRIFNSRNSSCRLLPPLASHTQAYVLEELNRQLRQHHHWSWWLFKRDIDTRYNDGMDSMFDMCFKEAWLLEKKEMKNTTSHFMSWTLFAFIWTQW